MIGNAKTFLSLSIEILSIFRTPQGSASISVCVAQLFRSFWRPVLSTLLQLSGVGILIPLLNLLQPPLYPLQQQRQAPHVQITV